MRVIAIVQNLNECTAYLKNGTSVKFPADSEEAVKLIKAIPDLALKGEADVDIVIGTRPVKSSLEEALGIKIFSILTEVAARLEKEPELMKDLEEISTKYLGNLAPDSTLVAKKGDKVITGIERLEPYLKRASTLNQYKGLKALLDRCFAMAEKPKHSVEDLLDFLKFADLPIADDGSIIAYKMVDIQDGYFVDCHTGKVKQNIGYKVFMDPKMVDPSRHEDCSHGLHIASRSYLRSFQAQACLLVKFNPEDVIAVPIYGKTKVRVCAYEILARLPDKLRKLLVENTPITTEPEGKDLLAKAINCQFPPATLYTEIKGEQGSKCVYGKLNPDGTKVVEKRKVSAKEATALDDTKQDKTACKKNLQDAKKLKELVNKATKKASEVKHPMQELHKALENMNQENYYYAEALRKRLKKSWEALGVKPEDLTY